MRILTKWLRSYLPGLGVDDAQLAEDLTLRGIAVELQMVSTHGAVHIGGGDFMTIHPRGGNKPMEDIEANLLPSAQTALDELVWWARATMAAKSAEA